MRLLDADILSYALYEGSPAYGDAWGYLKKAISGGVEVSVCHTTVIEAYNALVWYYRLRPTGRVLEKLGTTVGILKVAPTSMMGMEIAKNEGIPLGDGFLIATAIENRLPIVVSNDRRIIEKAPKYGLISENPISENTRSALGKPKLQ